MATLICRPYITLRNKKVLYAWEKGLKAFCFWVDEEKQKIPSDANHKGTSVRKKKI